LTAVPIGNDVPPGIVIAESNTLSHGTDSMTGTTGITKLLLDDAVGTAISLPITPAPLSLLSVVYHSTDVAVINTVMFSPLWSPGAISRLAKAASISTTDPVKINCPGALVTFTENGTVEPNLTRGSAPLPGVENSNTTDS
jgi:hypothetical protein